VSTISTPAISSADVERSRGPPAVVRTIKARCSARWEQAAKPGPLDGRLVVYPSQREPSGHDHIGAHTPSLTRATSTDSPLWLDLTKTIGRSAPPRRRPSCSLRQRMEQEMKRTTGAEEGWAVVAKGRTARRRARRRACARATTRGPAATHMRNRHAGELAPLLKEARPRDQVVRTSDWGVMPSQKDAATVFASTCTPRREGTRSSGHEWPRRLRAAHDMAPEDSHPVSSRNCRRRRHAAGLLGCHAQRSGRCSHAAGIDSSSIGAADDAALRRPVPEDPGRSGTVLDYVTRHGQDKRKPPRHLRRRTSRELS